MNTRNSAFSGGSGLPKFESLEDRRLLSVATPSLPTLSNPVITTGPIGSPQLPTMPTAPISVGPTPPISISPIATNSNVVHAETGEAFTAVVAKIGGLAAVPSGYTMNGSINWGDGTPESTAKFVTESNGAIDIIGSHTYTKAGIAPITVTITRIPPPGTLGAVVLVGQIHSIASIVAASGVTLNETAGVAFTTGLGSFSSNLSSQTLKAVINWGDGTTSIGKLIAEPVTTSGATSASPVLVGRYQVVGTHTYAQTRSYLVNVVVTATAPPPVTTSPTATSVNPTPPFIIRVANFDSVIDVLPAVQVTPITAS